MPDQNKKSNTFWMVFAVVVIVLVSIIVIIMVNNKDEFKQRKSRIRPTPLRNIKRSAGIKTPPIAVHSAGGFVPPVRTKRVPPTPPVMIPRPPPPPPPAALPRPPPPAALPRPPPPPVVSRRDNFSKRAFTNKVNTTSRENYTHERKVKIADCPCTDDGEMCPDGCMCEQCEHKKTGTDAPYVFVDEHLTNPLGGVGSAILTDLRHSQVDMIRPPVVPTSTHHGQMHGDDDDRWFVPAQHGRKPAPHAAPHIM